MDIHIEFGLASLPPGYLRRVEPGTKPPTSIQRRFNQIILVDPAMPTRIVFTSLSVFVLLPSILFSVLDSKPKYPAPLTPMAPQSATLTINEYLADPGGSSARS